MICQAGNKNRGRVQSFLTSIVLDVKDCSNNTPVDDCETLLPRCFILHSSKRQRVYNFNERTETKARNLHYPSMLEVHRLQSRSERERRGKFKRSCDEQLEIDV